MKKRKLTSWQDNFSFFLLFPTECVIIYNSKVPIVYPADERTGF